MNARALSTSTLAAACLLAAAVGSSPRAQCGPQKLVTLDEDNPATTRDFGRSVAMDGDTLVIGAPKDDLAFTEAGAVYVYVRVSTSWVLQQVLTADDVKPNDSDFKDAFGYAVAIDGERIAVGAPGDDETGTDTGAVYAFERNGVVWNPDPKLPKGSAVSGQQIGYSVAIEGNRIVAGTPFAGLGSNSPGQVYEYEQIGPPLWQLSQVITDPALPGGGGEHFGFDVDISNGVIVVGAEQRDVGPLSNAGRAYVFEQILGTYTLCATLDSFTPIGSEQFGFSVSIDGETLLVGAWGHGLQGSAYVFTGQLVGSCHSWSNQQQLSPPAGPSADNFGWSVDLLGDALLVGAPDGHSNVGATYLFEKAVTTWVLTQDFQPHDNGLWLDNSGTSVAVGEDLYASGAVFDTHTSPGVGSVSIYGTNIDHVFATGNPNSVGSGARLRASGSPFIADNCVEFRLTGLPPNEFGYLLMATDQDPGGTDVPGDGTLYLDGSIHRFTGNDVQFSGPLGEVTFQVDLVNVPVEVAIQPGNTRFFQFWYRDKNPGPTSNLSDAVWVTFL